MHNDKRRMLRVTMFLVCNNSSVTIIREMCSFTDCDKVRNMNIMKNILLYYSNIRVLKLQIDTNSCPLINTVLISWKEDAIRNLLFAIAHVRMSKFQSFKKETNEFRVEFYF